MPYRRLLLPCCLALALACGAPARAADPPPPSADELHHLVDTLNDPAARGKLIGELNALVQAQRATAPAAPATPADWVGRMLDAVSTGMRTLTAEAAVTGRMARDLPRAVDWLGARLNDAEYRAATLELIGRLLVVLIGAAGTEWLVTLLIARPRHALERWSARNTLGRWPLVVARVLLALVPIIAFVGAAYVVLPLATPDETTRLVAVALINANVLARAILAAARRVLVPPSRRERDGGRPSRLIRVDDARARYAYRWIRRLSWVGIYGLVLIAAAGLLGVPHSVHDLLQRVLGALYIVMLAVLIVQSREPIRRRLAGPSRRDDDPSTDEWHLGRAHLAEIWHVLAIAYLVVAYLVWALEIPNGFAFLASATLWTAVTLALLRVGLLVAGWLATRVGRAVVHDGAPDRLAAAPRTQGYLPLLHGALRALLILFAAVAILQAWGTDVRGWLASPLGHRMLSSVFSIAIILAVAVAAWEIASLMIARSLALGSAFESSHLRAQRLRTLLPLLQNALMVVIVVLTVLVILSELGIDIAPLLAGAGVVGLAIGFGAQTLVKDVITGLFFLLEDTVNIGDVVDVGGGHTGLVESMSIRSIRLRDLDGTVHTVPFSAVAAIKNMTKDVGHCVLDVLIDYRSDLDRALAVLREVDAEMRADQSYGALILAPIEIMGVERFADNAVVVRSRVQIVPIRRWHVAREFNRRIKLAFDRAGIGMVAAVPPPTPEAAKPDERPPEPRAVTH